MTCLFGQKPRKEEKGKAINLDKRKGRDKSKRRKEGAVKKYFPKKKKRFAKSEATQNYGF